MNYKNSKFYVENISIGKLTRSFQTPFYCYSKSRLSQNIKNFNKVLENTNLLFSDRKVNYQSSDISEVYGKSKDSGISYLMNEFSLPCLLNSDFTNFIELNRGSLYFNNYDKLYKLYKKIKKNKTRLNFIRNKIKSDTK